MEKIIVIIDNYMFEICVVSVLAIVILFLIRSFKRSMLIENGHARFVLEHFDGRTEKIHKWLTFIVLFIMLPVLAYVKYVVQFS